MQALKNAWKDALNSSRTNNSIREKIFASELKFKTLSKKGNDSWTVSILIESKYSSSTDSEALSLLWCNFYWG